MKFLNESEIQQLRTRQERGELQIKKQLSKLEFIGNQIKDIHLADSDVKTRSTDENNVNADAALSRKQKQLESLSQLIQDILLAILNLSGMVQTLEGDQSLNNFAQFTMDAEEHTKLESDVKMLRTSIKSLHQEIQSEIKLSAKNESNEKEEDTQNVRTLNRAEQESRFATVTKQLHELEDEDSDYYEQDTDEDAIGKLASYVNHGIQTNASQNQQRRTNLLSHAKQGKYASKGIILEAVLQSASRNESP